MIAVLGCVSCGLLAAGVALHLTSALASQQASLVPVHLYAKQWPPQRNTTHRLGAAAACRLPDLSPLPAALAPQQRLLRPSSRPAGGLQQPQADERGASQHTRAHPRFWPAPAASPQQPE